MNLTGSVLYHLPWLTSCCPVPPSSHLIRKQNAMIPITPKPPTSASCFLKMIRLPDLSIPCLCVTFFSLFMFYLIPISTPQVFSSPSVCDFVGRLFERRFPWAVEPTGWRRSFSPKLECRLPMTYSQWCGIKPCWKLYLTAASLRTTVETLTGRMTWNSIIASSRYVFRSLNILPWPRVNILSLSDILLLTKRCRGPLSFICHKSPCPSSQAGLVALAPLLSRPLWVYCLFRLPAGLV